MKREIKFKYIYGKKLDVSTYFSKVFTLDEIEGGDQFEEICDNPLLKDYRILYKLQWTGLKDKHGKEIYESDVVNSMDENYSVKYSCSNGAYYINEVDPDETEGWHLGGEGWRACEVIGNVHINPLLMVFNDN